MLDNSNSAGPITNKRSVESMVLLDDGQIAVIGGLIQDNMSDVLSKVPLLGDLPLVGGLFQYKTRARSKTNLMVFLRPTVLRDSVQSGDLTNNRYDYIRGEQAAAGEKIQPGALFPAVDPPLLPPRQPAARARPDTPR